MTFVVGKKQPIMMSDIANLLEI